MCVCFLFLGVLGIGAGGRGYWALGKGEGGREFQLIYLTENFFHHVNHVVAHLFFKPREVFSFPFL